MGSQLELRWSCEELLEMGQSIVDEVSDQHRGLLEKHLQLVLKENERTNLTRIDDCASGMLLHVEDSLVGVPEIEDAPEGLYIDLGTGGGFPGIPAAIMTGRPTLLVDSVGKKTQALERMVKELGLDGQVEVFTGRAEELALERPESAAVISARALSSLPSLLELAAPLLQMGGQLVCYKSHPEEEELSTALLLKEKLGMELISQRSVVLSDGETQRQIIVFKKVSEPTVTLPRRPGMAQKRPYKK